VKSGEIGFQGPLNLLFIREIYRRLPSVKDISNMTALVVFCCRELGAAK
jgi:hypothetical protein